MTLQLDRIVTLHRTEKTFTETTETSGQSSHTYEYLTLGGEGFWGAFDSGGSGISTFSSLENATSIELGLKDSADVATPRAWESVMITLGQRTAAFTVDSVVVRPFEAAGDPFSNATEGAVILTVSTPMLNAGANAELDSATATIANPGTTTTVRKETDTDVTHKLWARRSDSVPSDQLEFILDGSIEAFVRYATWTFRSQHGLTVPALGERFIDEDGLAWVVRGKAEIGRNYRLHLYCQEAIPQ